MTQDSTQDPTQDAAAAFGTANPVGGGVNSTSTEDDPSLTGDLLEIFFDSGRAGGAGGRDVWTATRANASDTFGSATNLTVNTSGDDTSPYISNDGLTLFWSASGPRGFNDIYMATRPTRGAAWSSPIHVAELSSGSDDSSPALSADGLTLYLTRSLIGGTDIYVATRATLTSVWGAPVRVTELATSSDDGDPWINTTGTLLVFSSNRPGGTGGEDIWWARRGAPGEVFGTPSPFGELATTADDADPWMSPDEHLIVFERANDIYMATR